MRILCVDDNTDDKAMFCSTYRLKEDLVDYAHSVNEAIAKIADPHKLSQYDLVLLDIHLNGMIKPEYKEYLKNIVNEDMLKNVNNGYGGFYLYLALLNAGFPNHRIGFLSAYINPDYKMAEPSLPINEVLQEIKNRGELHLSDEGITERLHFIKESIGPSHYNALLNMIKEKEWDSFDQKIELLAVHHQKVKKGPSVSENETNIHEYLGAFQKAGINIDKRNQFYKYDNQFRRDDDPENKRQTPLQQWVQNNDTYYMLRYGIIQGCQQMIHEIEKIEEGYKSSLASIKEKGRMDTYNHDIKSLLPDCIENNVMYFYKFRKNSGSVSMDYRDDRTSFEYQSNKIALSYGLDYFKNMLSTIPFLLPIREPANKGQIYDQIVKMLTHPWEAAEAYYRDKAGKREELFEYCLSAVAKSIRNWTAHARLSEFTEEDVAYIFIILMRTYFHSALKDMKDYEDHLFQYVLNPYLDKEKIQNRNEREALITHSLRNLNNENKYSKVNNINILSLFTEIGRFKNCPMEYLYRMFTHIAYYPYISFNIKGKPAAKPFMNFNSNYNDYEIEDIFSRLLLVSFNKGL